MFMEENLEKVFRKIVLPAFESLEDVRVEKLHDLKGWFRVNYYLNEKIDYDTKMEIETETQSLFRMMGNPKTNGILVDFHL